MRTLTLFSCLALVAFVACVLRLLDDTSVARPMPGFGIEGEGLPVSSRAPAPSAEGTGRALALRTSPFRPASRTTGAEDRQASWRSLIVRGGRLCWQAPTAGAWEPSRWIWSRRLPDPIPGRPYGIRFGRGCIAEQIGALRHLVHWKYVEFDLAGRALPSALRQWLGRLEHLEGLALRRARVVEEDLRALPHTIDLRLLILTQCHLARGVTERIPDFPVRSLQLRSSTVGDDHAVSLARVKGLRLLGLSKTGFTDRGLARLGGLTALRRLELRDSAITGSAFCHLSLPRLEVLDAGGSPVVDEALAGLAGCPRVRVLRLDGTRVRGHGLRYVGRLTTLELLDLDGAPLVADPAGLQVLTGLSRLGELRLEDSGIDERALSWLEELASRVRLELDGTALGEAALRRLRAIAGESH